MLYRPQQSVTAQKDFETVQADLAQVGITLKGLAASGNDFYGKYLTPGTAAKAGVWDLAEAGWGPDWYPTGGKSYFLPILDGNILPPSSSNFGFFNDPTLNTIMAAGPGRADRSPPPRRSGTRPTRRPWPRPPSTRWIPNRAHDPRLAGPQLHLHRPIQNCDLANVWLS